MALITSGTLAALRTEVRRQFADAYAGMQPQTFWNTVAMLVPSSTASNTYDWLGDFPDLREWIGDRVVKDIKENAYQITNRLYEGTVGIARTAIEDDSIGTVGARIRNIAQAAARHPDKLVADLVKNGHTSLCYDGQYFFDVDHPVAANTDGTGAVTSVSNAQAGAGVPWYLLDCSSEIKPFIFQERTKPEFDTMEGTRDSDTVFIKDQYLYGIRYRCNAGYGFWQKAYRSQAALTGDNLDAAIAAMMSFKGDGGKPLGITPTHLLVPPAHRAAANKAVKVMLGDGGASNANYQAVEVIVTPWLA
ncbi:MAG: Mu-like prophage major head subunit gpT family protein [Fuscovulum sp.]|nr:Mu-like prophage major head subunit gpT family protein [Fuscovulum sp.]